MHQKMERISQGARSQASAAPQAENERLWLSRKVDFKNQGTLVDCSDHKLWGKPKHQVDVVLFSLRLFYFRSEARSSSSILKAGDSRFILPSLNLGYLITTFLALEAEANKQGQLPFWKSA